MASELQQLQWAVQALAQPPSEQIRLFPHFVCVADELALDFSHWFEVAAAADLLTSEQHAALRRLDEALAASSGSADADIWTDEALHRHPVWAEFRHLAAEVLQVFDWSPQPPPSNRATYVGPGNA